MATNHQEEKDISINYLEQVDTAGDTASDKINDARIEAFTPEEQKKIIWRIDRRLVLTLGFLYCVSLMDRTNTGIAVVAGMGVDLLLIKDRYSIIVLVFFIPYVFFQPPATVILRKVGPRAFLPTITLFWGITMIGMAFVKTWTQLIPLRILLGIFEAGFFPGCAYLLSCWYPRYMLQKRNAVFYLIGSLSSAFSGILAYGFSQMAGLGVGDGLGAHYGPDKLHPTRPRGIGPGLAGWRWIFIMQGLITCILAIGAYFTIVNFPEKAAHVGFGPKFLNQKEVDFIVATIEKDRHDAIPEEFKVGQYLKSAGDLKVWGFAALFGLTTTVTYAIAYFLPIILEAGMGFNKRDAQCLIAPPYVLAAIVTFVFAWFADKYRIRSPFIIANAVLMIIGLTCLGFAKSVGVRYFGVFLATAGCNANVPAVLTWQANNIRGQWKRALTSATLVGAGGIGGIIGSTVFRKQDSPGYRPGIYATLGASVLIIIISLLLDLKFWRANKRAAAGGKVIEGLHGFRYTL
ncbi:retrograde regulation protein 2 [Aureobasidium pullulans]|uniref:Retrograde regulation protein 2 n=1 Tax=Aureobasidium pullulans TaxID=5580 RepID=A0A4S9DXT3_AURPU|nr:retrograde regulation protein 2 [Aureobasidium pullulans]THX62342.1 retrograde regulation protein 2 [Aureobasidium pullulans]THX93413.1 retrograde regulation protein 2 [Aureobasidium pullulans]THZ50933.1 retrograde regulation protein 2 [Aureobasidium pullulans]